MYDTAAEVPRDRRQQPFRTVAMLHCQIPLTEIPTTISVRVQIGTACRKARANVGWGQDCRTLAAPPDDAEEGTLDSLTHNCAAGSGSERP